MEARCRDCEAPGKLDAALASAQDDQGQTTAAAQTNSWQMEERGLFASQARRTTFEQISGLSSESHAICTRTCSYVRPSSSCRDVRVRFGSRRRTCESGSEAFSNLAQTLKRGCVTESLRCTYTPRMGVDSFGALRPCCRSSAQCRNPDGGSDGPMIDRIDVPPNLPVLWAALRVRSGGAGGDCCSARMGEKSEPPSFPSATRSRIAANMYAQLINKARYRRRFFCPCTHDQRRRQRTCGLHGLGATEGKKRTEDSRCECRMAGLLAQMRFGLLSTRHRARIKPSPAHNCHSFHRGP